MLNFLSYFLRRKRPARQVVLPEGKKESSVSQDAKLEAMKLAEQLPDDEAMIVTFLLQCRFADARFVAAQKIHSRQAMEQVRSAMQKTDRRVYRMMQDRLNEMTRHDEITTKVGLLVGKASALAEEIALTPNLVAELDREWRSVTEKHKENLPMWLKTRFEELRLKLESRLSTQLTMQREVKATYESLLALEQNSDMKPGERAERLEEYAEKLATWKKSPEWFSLPRQLLTDFESVLSSLNNRNESYRREFEAIERRSEWLSNIEKSDLTVLDEMELRQQWSEMPNVNSVDRMIELEERFHVILVQMAVIDSSEIDLFKKLELTLADAVEYISTHLSSLKQAVSIGDVRQAVFHDDALRQLAPESIILDPAQAKQLEQLRVELRHMPGWAKTCAQLSREKLIELVQELPEHELGIDELSHVVVQAREHWKLLNAVAGQTTREQWEQFDNACNQAYEPVLEYAQKQAIVKEQNRLIAETIVENIRAFAHHFESELLATDNGRNSQFDWKPVINFYRQVSQSWRQLGLMAKKEKKRLDETFTSVIQPIRERLYEQTRLEIERRQQLISEVEKIDPSMKDAGRLLHMLQEKWQSSAKAFPLDNREDKKLWTRFREACERLHEKRMENNKAIEQERLQHLQQKESICTELEALASAGDVLEIGNRLDELLDEWKTVGFVPREAMAELQIRLDAAVSGCHQRIEQLKSEQTSRAVDVFAQKLELCGQLENHIVSILGDTESQVSDTVQSDEELEARWNALPALSDRLEAVMKRRFNNGLKALAVMNHAYAKRLAGNVDALHDNLLKFEVMHGIQSPAHLDGDRLNKQMELLQETLGGNDALKKNDVERQLLELPALMTDEDRTRIVELVAKVGEPG